MGFKRLLLKDCFPYAFNLDEFCKEKFRCKQLVATVHCHMIPHACTNTDNLFTD